MFDPDHPENDTAPEGRCEHGHALVRDDGVLSCPICDDVEDDR